MDNKMKASCSIAISDSPSKSLSACTSPLPFSALSPIPIVPVAPGKYSMEEVWKDISLSSLQGPASASTSAADLALQLSSFQDLLPNKEPRSRTCKHSSLDAGSDSVVFGSQPPTGDTSLSLISGQEFHYVESSDSLTLKPRSPTHASSKEPTPFTLPHLNSLSSSIVEFSILCKKRVPEDGDSTNGHKNKRMMKNRESAARSRARKQAYTHELELKVESLVEENAKLRRQLTRLCTAAAAQFQKSISSAGP